MILGKTNTIYCAFYGSCFYLTTALPHLPKIPHENVVEPKSKIRLNLGSWPCAGSLFFCQRKIKGYRNPIRRSVPYFFLVLSPRIADRLAAQDDIRVLEVKDYIRNPKPNGYRSYHMIIEVPVFFMDAKELMRVEVQLRTVAMDFWASLEHEIKYKKDIAEADQLVKDLKACADTIA